VEKENMEKEHIILKEHLSGEGTYYPSGASKWRRNTMFLLHLGAPEGSDVPSPLRCTGRIIEHLSGEGTSYPSVTPKWRRNILSFRST
jgi:hypothetical protein